MFSYKFLKIYLYLFIFYNIGEIRLYGDMEGHLNDVIYGMMEFGGNSCESIYIIFFFYI